MNGFLKKEMITALLITAFFAFSACRKPEPATKKIPDPQPPTRETKQTEEKSMEEKTKERAKAFLDKYFERAALLEKEQAMAYWKAANSGKKEDFAVYEKAEFTLKKLRSDPKSFSTIEDLLKKKDLLDELTRRSLEVAYISFKGNQLPDDILGKLVKESTEIGRTFSTFRGKMGKKEYSNNELLEMLQKAKKTKRRREIWMALKQVGNAVGPKIMALAKIRNEAAKKLGYSNYWEMKIRHQEHDPEQIMSLFDELEKLTRKPFEEMKAKMDKELARKFRASPAKLMPWHYDNPFFQSPPPSSKIDPDIFYKDKSKEEIVAISKRFFADIDLPIEDILERSDLYERKGKDQHAFCIAIDREGDVRILVNIKPTAQWMGTQLHELGHALYYKYMDFNLPYNLRDVAHILTTEGVAMLFGALALHPDWLKKYTKADPKKVKKIAHHILEQRRREQLIFTRWTLVMLHFEKALYENPSMSAEALNTLWWDMVEKYQKLNRPKGRNASDWAAKPHFTIAPVYYHNYMMGELYAAQLRSALSKNVEKQDDAGKIKFNKELGAYMKEKVFEPSRKMQWPDFVESSTGAPLSAKFFAAELK